MQNDTQPIDNLNKISLSLEAGTTSARMDMTPSPCILEFIFGIGSGGITPFEYQLAGKRAGDTVTLYVDAGAAGAFFEHLACPLLREIDGTGPFYLKATVLDVTPAGNREIIRAMAENTECGGGCGCGCGC